MPCYTAYCSWVAETEFLLQRIYPAIAAGA